MDARAQVIGLARACLRGEIFYTCVKMGIADILKEGPKSAEEVALEIQKTGACRVDFLARLLRCAAANGIFERSPVDLKYSLNELSQFLVEGPQSLSKTSLHVLGTYMKQAYMHMEDNIRYGRNAFETAHKEPLFDYLQTHEQEREIFNLSMEGTSRDGLIAELMNSHYPLGSFKHLVDIGGGRGLFLASVLRLNPHLTGTVYDLPLVIEEGNALLETDYKDIKDRLTFVGGSFF